MGFIYKITSPSNKPYVGQTKRKVPEKRWKQHCQGAARGNSPCIVIGNAIRKYGAENMKFEVIEECPDDMLNEREHYWIDKLKSLSPNGYNLRSGGGVNELCEESRARISATKRQKSIDTRGYVGCIIKNRRGSFIAREQGKVHLGTFSTFEEAETALREYTRDPENAPPTRRIGTVRARQNGRWEAWYSRKYLGSFPTREEAEDAVERYKRDPENAPPARRMGNVSARQSGRWQAKYKNKYLGMFDTQEEAEDAIERYRRDPDTFPLPEPRPRARERGTGCVHMRGRRWRARFRDKPLGTFDSKDEAEAAIQAHIESQTV